MSEFPARLKLCQWVASDFQPGWQCKAKNKIVLRIDNPSIWQLYWWKASDFLAHPALALMRSVIFFRPSDTTLKRRVRFSRISLFTNEKRQIPRLSDTTLKIGVRFSVCLTLHLGESSDFPTNLILKPMSVVGFSYPYLTVQPMRSVLFSYPYLTVQPMSIVRFSRPSDTAQKRIVRFFPPTCNQWASSDFPGRLTLH